MLKNGQDWIAAAKERGISEKTSKQCRERYSHLYLSSDGCTILIRNLIRLTSLPGRSEKFLTRIETSATGGLTLPNSWAIGKCQVFIISGPTMQ